MSIQFLGGGNKRLKIQDNTAAAMRQYEKASRYAMDAATQFYFDQVRKRYYEGYYTSEAFRSTAGIVQGIRKGTIEKGSQGWEARVGIPENLKTKAMSGKRDSAGRFLKASETTTVGKIALYWELGHHNVFSRRKEHVPIWKPVAIENAQRIGNVFKRVFLRYTQGAK
jgi:hypothetical protein